MNGFDPLSAAVQMAAPNNAVLYDDKNNPSVMVRIPKFQICDVIDGGSEATHPAFIVGGREIPEIWISKYSNVLRDGRACSLPGASPDSEVVYEDAKRACEAKGKGWHMMSNAEWAAVALWCKKNGFLPRGNNAFAKDVHCPHERGTVTMTYESKGVLREGKTATGSGPAAWAHDGTPAGIHDMNGNVWAQVTGLRLVDGEIQIVRDNDSALGIDESYGNGPWRAILPDGSLTDPGSPASLKIAATESGLAVGPGGSQPADKWSDALFGAMGSEGAVPELLKALALFPTDGDGYGEQKIWVHNMGERLPWRGGTWDAFANSGVFCMFACYPRGHVSKWLGFRAAYVNLDE